MEQTFECFVSTVTVSRLLGPIPGPALNFHAIGYRQTVPLNY